MKTFDVRHNTKKFNGISDLEVYFDIKFFDVFDDFLKFGLKHHQMIARN